MQPLGLDGDVPLPGDLRLRLTGVPLAARQRLLALGVEVVEAGDAGDVHAEIVSTRAAGEDLAEVSHRLATTGPPVVVLAHTGGERLAAELVAGGALGFVGEGNEDALLSLVEDDRTPEALLRSFERRFGDGGASDGRGHDPTTGLADRCAFERQLSSLVDAGELPRVAFLRVVSDRWTAPVPDPVVALQRRRLASAMTHLTAATGAELHSTGHGEFGLVAADMSSRTIEAVGDRLVEVARTFRDRGQPLRLVLGHAGPESSHDLDEVVELARRALDAAAGDGTRSVLGGEQLASGVSVTTELEASLKLVAAVEAHLPQGRGHGERVGRIAAELGRTLAWPPAAIARLQLAGHLHDVGHAGLPPEIVAGPEGLSPEQLDRWRTAPIRGAALLRLTAGPLVAAAVEGQHERWDGQGFPHGRRGAEIPETARLLAVAQAVEELLLDDRGATTTTLAERLRARAGSELDPELVDTAVAALPALVGAGRASS